MPKGQALNEYLLTGGIIVLAALFTLGALGQQLNGMFSGMIQMNGAARTVVADFGLPAGPGTQTLSFPVQNGGETVQINIPNYPANLAQAIETAGASGTSELLVSVLTQMADFLDNLDPPQSDDAAILRELSDSGFQLASTYQYIETKVSTSGTWQPSNAAMLSGWLLNDPQEKIDALKNPFVKAMVEDAFGKLSFTCENSVKHIANEINKSVSEVTDGTSQPSPEILFQQMNQRIMNEALQDTTLQSSNVCNASSANQVEGLSCIPQGTSAAMSK
jgi:hypothetical protein